MNAERLLLVLAAFAVAFHSCTGRNVAAVDEYDDDTESPVHAVDDPHNQENDTVDIGSGFDDPDKYHGFTHEELDRNRMIRIDWYGNETETTDDEVVRILEYVRSNNLTFLSNEPHFIDLPEDKRSIIGSDDRYKGYHYSPPYSAIGYLSTGCTGYLLGPRHLITAAHCLHPDGDTAAIFPGSQLSFYLNRNCYSYGTYYGISEVLVYSQYTYYGNSDYDLACLLLTSTAYNWMGFAFREPMPTVSGEICGYPGDIPAPAYECFYCSSCSDIKHPSTGWWSVNKNRLEYTCDTVGGMSGSPVMTGDHDSTSHWYSYGVHTNGGSSNKGARITETVFYDICQWICDTGGICSVLC
jgi:V8-like Glu-specific endopeptidase